MGGWSWAFIPFNSLLPSPSSSSSPNHRLLRRRNIESIFEISSIQVKNSAENGSTDQFPYKWDRNDRRRISYFPPHSTQMVGDMRSTSAHLKAYIESPVKSIFLLGRLVGWAIGIMSSMNGIILVKPTIKVPKKQLDYPFYACRAC